MKRLIFALLLIITGLPLFTQTRAQDQQLPEPIAIIDAVLKSIGSKVGVTITRRDIDYTWERINFPDGSLDCPQPGVKYPQAFQYGYKVLITYKGVTYDYRATEKGDRIFECTPNGAVTTVATQIVGPATALPTIPTTSNQSAVFTNAVAYIGGDGNVIVGLLNPKTTVPLTSNAKGKPTAFYPFFEQLHVYGHLSWSPDGTTLAFTDDKDHTLYLARTGQKALAIASGLAIGYPPSWSPDGREIAYAVTTTQTSGSNGVTVQIQAIPVAGGQPRVAGQFVEGIGCGGGGFDPAVAAYFGDAGYEGNHVILAQVANGYLYTSACTGIGLGLATANNQGGWVRTDLSGAALSPDQTHLIAVRRQANSELLLSGVALESIDLATGKGTDLAAQPNVSQAAWSADGQSILYSTVTPAGQISVSANNQTANAIFSGGSFNAPINTVSLWKMPAMGGSSTQLITREGYAIGNISASPDGSVAFSFIGSLVDMVKQVELGKGLDTIIAAAPLPQLYVLPAAAPNLTFYSLGSQPVISNGQFTPAPPENGAVGTAIVNGTGSTAPPALVIGQTAVVTATKSNLNMRSKPSTTAEVKRLLLPGTIVTILAGPTEAEGFRWWQVRAPDSSVGWVVDQVTDKDGTTNTLTPQAAG